ncbi:MAG: metallophosphoesterase family protein [Candidatus Geothermincolia bacterium]
MSKTSSEKNGKKRTRRRVSKPLAAAALIVGLVLLSITAIKIHETWMLPKPPGNWNQSQLARIDHGKQNFKFVVFADTHNSSVAFGRIQKAIDDKGYLFAVDVGDMSIDSGRIKSRLFLNQILKMKTPVITAVGNHDIAAGGYGNYEKVFGPRYYSFTVGKCLFIMLDDAEGKSLDKKQMAWFREELKKSTEFPKTFVFMHVPTFRGRRDLKLPMDKFLADRKSAEEFKQVCIENNVDVVFSGHCHTFDYDIWPGDVHYVVTGGGGGRLWDVEQYRGMYHYIEISITGDKGSFELEPIKQSRLHFLYQYIEQPWAYVYTYAAARYWMLAPILLVAFLVLAFLAVWRGRKKSMKPES